MRRLRVEDLIGEAVDVRGRAKGREYQPLSVTILGAEDGETSGTVKISRSRRYTQPRCPRGNRPALERRGCDRYLGYQVQRVGGCRLGGVGFFNPFGEVKVDPPPFERRLARALAGCGVGLLSL